MEDLALRWEYLWLASGGLLLILTLLAFIYLLAEKRTGWIRRFAQNGAFQRLDRLLADHVSWLWTFIRHRFSIREWHGLALTAATIVSFAAVCVFALITESWMEEEVLYAFDQRVHTRLVEAADAGAVSFMRIITHFGDGLTVAIAGLTAGGLLLAYGRRWEVLSLALSVGVGSGVMFALKWIFERSRPTEQIIQAAGHSFPSGHAFLATTLYGWLIYLTWRLVWHDAYRIIATMALTMLIFLVGLSRVVLRVHWTSDVAGGFTIGLAWLVCSLILARVLRAYFSRGSAEERRSDSFHESTHP